MGVVSGAISFAPMSQMIVAAVGPQLWLLDSTTGGCIWEYECDPGVRSISYSTDGGAIAAGCPSNLCVIDEASGDELWTLDRPAFELSYSPIGNTIAARSANGP